MRERCAQSALVGFTTYTGTLTAASDWGALHETKRVHPALPESWEVIFHQIGVPQFLVNGRTQSSSATIFMRRLRITSTQSSIFDETSAVEPLPHVEEEQTPEIPETYPIGV